MGTDTKNVIDDSQRAQSLGVRSFDITTNQLMETVNLYKSRTFDEEINYIQSEFGSVSSIIEKLKVNPDAGLQDGDEQDF